jgi:hypothetical protein
MRNSKIGRSSDVQNLPKEQSVATIAIITTEFETISIHWRLCN